MKKHDASRGVDHPKDQLPQDDVGEGLSDDERLSREKPAQQQGARVKPGPADEARLPES